MLVDPCMHGSQPSVWELFARVLGAAEAVSNLGDPAPEKLIPLYTRMGSSKFTGLMASRGLSATPADPSRCTLLCIGGCGEGAGGSGLGCVFPPFLYRSASLTLPLPSSRAPSPFLSFLLYY